MKTIEVTKNYIIEITFLPKMFGHLSEDEYLKEFSDHFFKVNSIDDLYRYIASIVDINMVGVMNIEGIGRVSFYDDSNLDVKLVAVYEDVETEIL